VQERELRDAGRGGPGLLTAAPVLAGRRLPSIGVLVEAARAAGRRFPLTLACGFAAAAAAILTADDVGPAWLHDRLLAAATLGLPLCTATTLLGERLRRAGYRAALAVAAVAVLAAVDASWNGWSEPVRFARYVELSLTFHLLVAFAPFVGRDRTAAFWEYNRVLFTRFLIAGLSSGTLFLGLALALAALDKLFGVELPRTAYLRVWALCAFVFTTWFFLGGVPRDPGALEQPREYPPVLRVFAQYTLVPLVTVYLVILSLYFAKVVVSWDWPSGWIGYLVSGVAGAGILTLLLVHPLAERPDQRWVGGFARAFWAGMLPAVVMLWLAIYQRIHQYGFTEPRYFLLLLSLWLGAIAVFFGATRSRAIQIIPMSLCLLSAAAFAGPWSAYAVSRRSQLGRVRDLLSAHGMLAGGAVRRAAADFSGDDRRALSGAVGYLVATHGSGSLRPLLGDSFATAVIGPVERGPSSPEARARAIVEALGVSYADRRGNAEHPGVRVTFEADDRVPTPIAGYDLLVPIRTKPPSGPEGGGGPYALLVRSTRSIRVVRAGRILIDVPLDPALQRARATAAGGGRLPGGMLRAEAANDRVRVLVLLERVGGYAGDAGLEIRDVQGLVLLAPRSGR
jgi:hypothetical protein